MKFDFNFPVQVGVLDSQGHHEAAHEEHAGGLQIVDADLNTEETVDDMT